MTGSDNLRKRIFEFSFGKLILSIVILHFLFLYLSGYFEIGLISDDYLNFISAGSSSFEEKFSGSIPFYSNYHFRPLWFLSMDLSIHLHTLLDLSKDNFVQYRAENLICFYIFTVLACFFLKQITGNKFSPVLFFLICLIYPCNLNSICWTAGRVDIICGIFLMSSLIFSYRHFRSGRFSDFMISLTFMILSLFTKETSVIIPVVTLLIFLISFGKDAVLKIKYLLLCEFIILICYFIFKIFYIGNSLSGVLTIYGDQGIFNRAGVIIRALVSLTVPYDYLSVQYYTGSLDITFILYMSVLVIVAADLIIHLKKSHVLKYLYLVCIVFLITISPNLIAGYFRPQLILIPFIITFLTLFILLSKSVSYNRPVKLLLFILIAFWSCLSFNLVKEWNFAYNESRSDINEICKEDIDFSGNKKVYLIGIPSRYRMASMLDYASGPFNYWCRDGFLFEREITDIIHIGALDVNSLNSEIKVAILDSNELDVSVTGDTQYLLKLDLLNNEFRDNQTEISFSEFNSFGKPTKAKIKFISDDRKVFIFSNGKILKAGI